MPPNPVEAVGTVDAQTASTAPWKTLRVFHKLPQGILSTKSPTDRLNHPQILLRSPIWVRRLGPHQPQPESYPARRPAKYGGILPRHRLGWGLDWGGGLDWAGGIDWAGGVGQELDIQTLLASGNLPPPNELTACVIGVDAAYTGGPLHRTRLDWLQPNVGAVDEFTVWRMEAGSNLAVSVGTVTGATFALIDPEELPDDVEFAYFVVATFDELDESGNALGSGPSNFASITAVNDPPLASNDPDSEPAYVTFIGAPLIVAAAEGVLANDTLSVDSASPTELRAVAVELLNTPSSNSGTVTLASDGVRRSVHLHIQSIRLRAQLGASRPPALARFRPAAGDSDD